MTIDYEEKYRWRRLHLRVNPMDSPFLNILHTNTIPSDSECRPIREFLVAPRQEVAKLNDEIQRLQSLLEQVTAQRDRLNVFVDAHLALISPIRRLPDDIVAEIFKATLPTDRNVMMSSAEAPLLLSSVFQVWRRLALSTPRLWASFHIVIPASEAELPHLGETTSLWLSRSGALPLSVSLFGCLRLIGSNDRYRNPLRRPDLTFTPLAAHALRSVALRLFSSTRSAVLRRPPTTGTSFPSSNCRLYGMSRWRACEYPSPSPGASFVTSLARKPIPNLSHARALNVFRECSYLETCALTITHHDTEGLPLELCRMEFLLELCIVDPHQASTDFFANVDLPRLHTLEYHTPHLFTLPFTTLLTPTNQLLTLRLKTCWIGEGTIEGLSLVPALRELCICYDPDLDRRTLVTVQMLDPPVWSALIPKPQNPHELLFPSLRVITLMKLHGLTDGMLIDFVRGRTGAFADVARLQKVKFYSAHPAQVDILAALQQPIADGLKIDVKYTTPPPPARGSAKFIEGDLLSDEWDIDF
ncbi:hypothetical protein B0H16DRAFT_1797754 [Mycena metata]|uniref:F-box domain-containing protein n=1 Tax=Mycena metata TaxID=1033252 RepID=A0AAD7HDJ1_9AGAR|nr:hypothetical protein B0H16DRAFT_1797754 [Mycena metata]